MEKFSKTVTKFSFALATSLMLVSCGSSGSNSGSSSNSIADVSNSDSVTPPVVKPIGNEKVVYVCADGKSGADGSSWDNCKSDIQSAIKQAQDSKKDLWFLAGDYNLTQTIVIENKDVKLYGGFKGTEKELSDRKLDTNVTVLSGNKKIQVLSTSQLTSKSILDGFVITQGKVEYDGAGMYNSNSNITISNVTFSENEAIRFDGFGFGTMYNEKSNITLTNVSFIKNNADYGGAMYNEKSNITLTNVSFVKNNAKYGGAISNHHTNLIITNTSFSKNNTIDYGGAIDDNPGSNIKLINVTFSENVGSNCSAINTYSSLTLTNVTITKNIGSPTISISETSSSTIKNSIIWNEGATEMSKTPTITNSIIKGDSQHNGNKNPLLSEPKTKIVNGVTHIYYDLEANSPAINTGNNDDNNETTDQIGNNRKNGTIDMGAVEKQDPQN